MKRFVIASLVALGTLSLTAVTGAPALAFPPIKVSASMPNLAAEPIIQVHGYHCRAAWVQRWGWHRHARACRNWRGSQYQQRRYYPQRRYDQQRHRNEQRRRSQR
ncbi:MAG: hypothetical protein RLT05_30805 [Bauldia litoralis]